MENNENFNENIKAFARRISNENLIGDLDKLINSGYSNKMITPNQFKTLIENPEKNSTKIQALSNMMSMFNGMLKEFINYKSLILTQDHYIYPSDSFKYKDKETLWKDELKVAEHLSKFTPKTLARWITKRELQNGEVYLYKRETSNGILMQEIPPEYCKIFFLDEYGIFRYGVDVTKIKKEFLGFFPKEITKAYDKYKNAKDKKSLKDFNGKYYIVGDDGAAFQLNQWETKGLPYYLHLFGSLMSLSEAEKIDSANNKLDNYKLLVQEVLTDKDGRMVMGADDASLFHNALKNTVPDGVGVVTTPLEVKPITLGDNKLKSYEYVNNIKKGIYDNAGISDDFFNGNSKTKEATILNAVIDTLVPIEIQSQVEKYLNFELSRKFKRGKWKVKFVQTTFYNRQNEISIERENLAIYGSKKRYLAAQGLEPLEILNVLYSEKVMNLEEYMSPMQTSHTISSKGRPEDSSEPESTNIET